MSSSASKLPTDGQGQHRQTMAALHPAAAVFRDELLGNVRESNNTLETSNARFRNLANLVQDIKLSFYTASPRREEQENPFHIEYQETFNVKHKLPRGSIVTTLDDEERLVLPIEDAPAHPVEDCGAIGCVKLYMAGGVPFGSFPSACNYVDDAAKMSVEEDGIVHLFLRLSKEIVIKGKLHSSQMSNEALIEHTEQPNFKNSLTLSEVMRGFGLFEGEEEYRKGIVYTPLSISIQVNPWLKKTLALVDQISPSGGSRANVELEPEDEMRRLVVEALGDSEHKELFHEYLALKLSNLMLSVNVSHSRGSFTVTLDEGNEAGNFWNIAEGAICDRSMMPVAELHRMEVSVLGMQHRLCNGLELIREMHPHPLMHHHTVWQMRFQAGCSNLKFYILVSFNWSEFTGEEIADIVDRFPSKMSNALYGIRNTIFPRNDTATFPLAFKANVLGISCDLSWAKRRLKWAGLWEE
jgi:hypothetical protein